MAERRVSSRHSLRLLGFAGHHQVIRGRTVAMLLLMAACTGQVDQQQSKVTAPLLPFDDLFVLEDTVRLDPTILIGTVSFLDIDKEDNLLVSDQMGSKGHLFDKSGNFKSTYDPRDCVPEGDGTMQSALFLSGGRVVYIDSSGQRIVFSKEGACVVTRKVQPGWDGACVTGDTLYTLPGLSSLWHHASIAYSLDLVEIGTTEVEYPKLRRLSGVTGGMLKRGMACFDDGPYYAYPGRADAVPLRASSNIVQASPPFFIEQSQDLPAGPPTEDLVENIMERTLNAGVFRINRWTRMVVYVLGPKWRRAEEARVGIVVASNTGQFPAHTALTSMIPVGAAHGYIYRVGDNELLPDGNVGNSVLLRYKFIPPTGASP